jgi:hypothetical protein
MRGTGFQAMSARWRDLALTAFFVLSFFSLGEAAFEAHVNYPAWLHIGEDGFTAYHRALSARIGWLLVPLAATIVLNVVLLAWPPPAVPRAALGVTLILQLVAAASAAMVQIPIQVRLSEEGFSRELIVRLMWTDLWYRKLPGYLRLGITAWMLHRATTRT